MNGKLENTDEILLTIKTRKDLYESVEKCIKANHSYEVCEIIMIPIENGSKEFFEWIDENTK